MAIKHAWRDETGAQDLVSLDESRQLDIGGSTPAAPISIDGTTWRKSDGNLGDTRAPSKSLDRTVGSLVLGSGATGSVTHNLGRTALARFEEFAIPNGVILLSHTNTDFTLANDGTVQRTIRHFFM